MQSGTALSAGGDAEGSMGVDFGDYDHDGRLDIFVTNFMDQGDSLYHNLGATGFDDVSWKAGVATASYPYVKWGTGFFDFDNDGWVDLFVASGHVYPQMDSLDSGPRYREPLRPPGSTRFRSLRAAARRSATSMTMETSMSYF